MNRPRLIERLERRLSRLSRPRTQMFVIVVITGLIAFLCSAALLRLGYTSMAIRYPLAVGTGYLALLAQLRIWLAFVQARRSIANPFHRRDVEDALERHPEEIADAVGRSAPDVLDVDLGEWVIPLMVVVGGAFAALYVVYAAPVLFAELIVDGVIVTGLYRRFRHLSPEGWLSVAIRKTVAPALMLILTVAVAGGLADMAWPEADSIGDVVRLLSSHE